MPYSDFHTYIEMSAILNHEKFKWNFQTETLEIQLNTFK